MMGYSDTYEYFLQHVTNSEEILREIYMLDTRLKQLHSKRKYVEMIDFRAIAKNQNGYFDFMLVSDMVGDNTEPYIKSNIESLTKLALGSFVYLDACRNVRETRAGIRVNVHSFDYNRGSFSDLMNTNQNYNYIMSCIPDADTFSEYFEGVLSGDTSYFSDYVDKKKNSVGKNGSKTLSYATAAGRAYADQQDSGYMQVLYYPILGVCVAIISIIIYLLILLR